MPKKFSAAILNAVKGIKRSIDQNPLNGITTATMATKASLSRNTLQEAFKAIYGIPLGQYKLKVRMKLAQKQLKLGKSIKETSIILKYSSPSSFSNAFRNYFNSSPTDWLSRVPPTNGIKHPRK